MDLARSLRNGVLTDTFIYLPLVSTTLKSFAIFKISADLGSNVPEMVQ